MQTIARRSTGAMRNPAYEYRFLRTTEERINGVANFLTKYSDLILDNIEKLQNKTSDSCGVIAGQP